MLQYCQPLSSKNKELSLKLLRYSKIMHLCCAAFYFPSGFWSLRGCHLSPKYMRAFKGQNLVWNSYTTCPSLDTQRSCPFVSTTPGYGSCHPPGHYPLFSLWPLLSSFPEIPKSASCHPVPGLCSLHSPSQHGSFTGSLLLLWVPLLQ